MSLIFCQSNFQIDKFYEYPSHSPFFTFDHINNTAYYFNVYDPRLLEDGKILDININGSTFSPLGTYDINPLYKNIYLDSLLSNEFEHKQGDYNYYENTIVINNKNNNDISAFLMLHARSQPRYYTSATKGISLQNYFLNISKTYENKIKSKFSTSFMYHNEDIVVPISSSQVINRFADSYMYGATFDYSFNRFDFNVSYSSQIMEGNQYLDSNNMIEEFTEWFKFNSKLDYYNNLSFNLNIDYKENNIEFNSMVDNVKNNFFDIILFNSFNYDNIIFDLGLENLFLDKVIYSPYVNIDYQFNKNIRFSYTRKHLNYINNNENHIRDIIPLQSLIIAYNYKNLLLHFEPFLYDHYGLRFNLDFDNNIILTNINSAVYKDSLSGNNTLPLNSFINYSLVISPPLNSDRFRPFIGFDGTFTHINNNNLFDPFEFGFINNVEYNSSKIINRLNFKAGFILDRFKITFNYLNFLNNDILFTFDDKYESLDNFFSLEVNWQFLD